MKRFDRSRIIEVAVRWHPPQWPRTTIFKVTFKDKYTNPDIGVLDNTVLKHFGKGQSSRLYTHLPQ